VRGLCAVLAALAPVAFLAVAHAHGTTSSGGGGAGYSFSWTTVFAHTLSRVVLWGSAAAFVVGAAVLWRARSRRLVALAVVAVLAACAGSVWGITHARSHASPRAGAFNALALGLPESAVLARLGEPLATSAQARSVRGGAVLPCLVYTVGDHSQASAAGPSGLPPADRIVAADDSYALLCFARGRLAARIGGA
jgi:hypothetical protein